MTKKLTPAEAEVLEVLLAADDAHKPEGSMWPELAQAIIKAGYRRTP